MCALGRAADEVVLVVDVDGEGMGCEEGGRSESSTPASKPSVPSSHGGDEVAAVLDPTLLDEGEGAAAATAAVAGVAAAFLTVADAGDQALRAGVAIAAVRV